MPLQTDTELYVNELQDKPMQLKDHPFLVVM